MGKLIITLINRPQNSDGKQLMIEFCDNYETEVKSVWYLARGLPEPEDFYLNCCECNPKYRNFNKEVADRNWNWREKNHTYSPTRFDQLPGYIGSYCMDALAMALHTVYYSSNLVEVLAQNADMGGDCDTVGSIAGQIAGALYGLDDDMLRLYSETQDFKKERFHVFIKAYKLAYKKRLELTEVA